MKAVHWLLSGTEVLTLGVQPIADELLHRQQFFHPIHESLF
jgi:hypothetical protein